MSLNSDLEDLAVVAALLGATVSTSICSRRARKRRRWWVRPVHAVSA